MGDFIGFSMYEGGRLTSIGVTMLVFSWSSMKIESIDSLCKEDAFDSRCCYY
jgi:hypothetical protein